MSTLKVHLKVAVNLLAGMCVFESYREDTERVAQILDHRCGWVSEVSSGTKFGRAFKTLETQKRKFIHLRGHIAFLKARIHNLYKIGTEEMIELEAWFNSLLTDHSYEDEYNIDCPWFDVVLVKDEKVQTAV